MQVAVREGSRYSASSIISKAWIKEYAIAARIASRIYSA